MNYRRFVFRSGSKTNFLALVTMMLISLGVLGGSSTGRSITAKAQTTVTGEQKTVLCSLEDAFSAIAQRANKGVVSITAIQTPASASYNGKRLDTLRGTRKQSGLTVKPSPEHIDDTNQVKASGSGTIVRQDGQYCYVLTNYHVVEDTYQVSVRLSSGTDLKGIVIGQDPVTDLAVVKISSPELSNANVVPMGDSSRVKIGSWALAVGSPYGFEHTLTVGVISALHRELDEDEGMYPDLIQTDAAINKGNSGGPLLDVEGNVIGINAAIASPTGGSVGLGFAIPVNAAKAVLDELIRNGRVVRGWIGLDVQEMNPALRDYYKTSKGVLVVSTDPKGPAARSGITSEDIIIRLGDSPIDDVRHMQQLVYDLKPGTSLPVVVIRNHQARTLQINVSISPSTPTGPPSPPLVKASKQIRVRNLTDNMARGMGLKNSAGVIVVKVPSNSSADDAGLSEGDIVIKMNGKTFTNQSEFDSMMRSVPSGGLVVLKVVRKGETRIIGYKQE